MAYTGVLEFEKPIFEIEERLGEMRALANGTGMKADTEIARLEKKLDKVRRDTFANLSCWQTVQLARHPRRPYTLDYIERVMPDFIELHGDRAYSDDHSIVAGLGRIGTINAVLIGHQKGRDTKANLYRNFGMPQPEGYRKAMRIMRLAERFDLPVVTLVDTPGAYPGLGAEARGQAEAIARNLFEMARLPVPIVTVVIGEGGSGGALALAVADRVMMLEHAIYSVISPEGCASILFRDAARARDAAEALKLTSASLKKQGIVDTVIPEPLGGAHRDWDASARALKASIEDQLEDLLKIDRRTLVEQRIEKFDAMGIYDVD